MPEFVDIPEGGLTVGRDAGNQLAIPTRDFPHVSAYHARLSFVRGVLTIEDLDSKNGTLVNGEDVSQSLTLQIGDVVQLGRDLGPRLLVVDGAADVGTTLSVPRQAKREPSADFGATTIVRLRNALGLSDDARDLSALRTRSRRMLMLLAASVAVSQCTVCHRPHSSTERHLLTLPETALCGSCHERLISCPSRTLGTVQTCSSCHLPHGGTTQHLLRTALVESVGGEPSDVPIR